MKQLSRALLRVVAACGMPVLLAACYGVRAAFDYAGKVLDKDTQEPVPGMKVSCERLVSADAGVSGGSSAVAASMLSGAQGDFSIDSMEACDLLVARDVDGAQNGSYADGVLSAPEASAKNLALYVVKQ
jgi:hypothetical protein